MDYVAVYFSFVAPFFHFSQQQQKSYDSYPIVSLFRYSILYIYIYITRRSFCYIMMTISRFAVAFVASVFIPSKFNPMSPFLSLNSIAAYKENLYISNGSTKRHKLQKNLKYQNPYPLIKPLHNGRNG